MRLLTLLGTLVKGRVCYHQSLLLVLEQAATFSELSHSHVTDRDCGR
jgi:hypothetical protein